MYDANSMSDSSLSDGSSSQEPRTTKQFERAIRNRTNRIVGTKADHHFRHKVPVFVATKAMEAYRGSGASDEQVREMQEELIRMMSDLMVGSMDPSDDNKLDSMYESVYRHHGKDEASVKAALARIFDHPTPSQKDLIETYNIRSAEDLRQLANDHVSEGLDTLRAMVASGKFSPAAISLVRVQYNKPYLKHFHPIHEGGTPNRGRILARTAESRHLESLVKRLSVVEAKIADRNRGGGRGSSDDDMALVIELSTVHESKSSHRRAPQPHSVHPERQASPNRLRREQEARDADMAEAIQQKEREDADQRRMQQKRDADKQLERDRLRMALRYMQQEREAYEQHQVQQEREAAEQRRLQKEREAYEQRRVQQEREAAEQRRVQQEREAAAEQRRVQQKRDADEQQERKAAAEQCGEAMDVAHLLSLLFGMRIPMYQPQYVNVMPFEPSFNVGSSSSSYNSPQVHIRSVSPLRTRATSNWDTFRTEHGNLGWTRAEMSENYHNR